MYISQLLARLPVGILLVVLCAVGVVSVSQKVSAQTDTLDSDVSIAAEESIDPLLLPVGAVSCFDYYQFGSVQAELSVVTPNTVSGVPVQFSGVLRNSNPYPIVEGVLFVKVFKQRTAAKDIYGPDVVDQFVVLDSISIPANGSVPVSFSWNVPAHAQSGEYELATFFSVARKFSMLGLSFTDDVVGNTVSFGVEGADAPPVSIDKESVTVSGESYSFATFPPVLGKNDSVEVRALVHNPNTVAETVTVSWEVYRWDSLLRQNVVQEKRETLTVPAKGKTPISITVTDNTYSVYLAQATLAWKDTKSVVGVRFARSEVNQPRIHFPSVLFFPLVAGQENTLFSCLHNAGEAEEIGNTRLDVVLTDEKGDLIHEIRYEGAVSSAMMALAESFVPEKSYDRFTLDARLFKDGVLVDESRYEYDCTQIDATLCVSETEKVQTGATSLAIVMGGVVLLLVVLGALIRRFTKQTPTTMPPAQSI